MLFKGIPGLSVGSFQVQSYSSPNMLRRVVYVLLHYVIVFSKSMRIMRNVIEEPRSMSATTKNNNFLTLELDNSMLKGARWANEQRRIGRRIEVYNSVEILDFSEIKAETMCVGIDLNFRQRWKAEDMTLPDGLFLNGPNGDGPEVFIHANPDILKSVWSPDSYFPTTSQTDINSVTTDQVIVNIFQNKTIILKARLSTTVECYFDFRLYTIDTQSCNFTIESFIFPDDTVLYLWETYQPPIVYSPTLKHLRFEMKLPMILSNGTNRRWGRGERYPYVNIEFSFTRRIGHNIMEDFIPSILIVVLSWFSFWFGIDSGRVALLITCMLSVVTMHVTVKGATPHVSYVTVMDIWMVTCMLYVFLSLAEYVIVYSLFSTWKKRTGQLGDVERRFVRPMFNNNKSSKVESDYSGSITVNVMGVGGESTSYHIGGGANNYNSWRNSPWEQNENNYVDVNKAREWEKLDTLARIIFPMSFCMFNGIFWPVVLHRAGNLKF